MASEPQDQELKPGDEPTAEMPTEPSAAVPVPELSDATAAFDAAAPPATDPAAAVPEPEGTPAAADLPAEAVAEAAVPADAVESPTATEPAAVAPDTQVAAETPVPDSNSLTQAELDALAGQLADQAVGAVAAGAAAIGGESAPPAEPTPAEAVASAQPPSAGGGGEPQVVGHTPVRVSAADANPFVAPEVPKTPSNEATSIDMLDDVELDVKIELGRANMYIEDVLRLGVGSVVELDKLAGDPVDIYVNDRLIARGEVLVLNENFCVRINHIESPAPELADGS